MKVPGAGHAPVDGRAPHANLHPESSFTRNTTPCPLHRAGFHASACAPQGSSTRATYLPHHWRKHPALVVSGGAQERCRLACIHARVLCRRPVGHSDCKGVRGGEGLAQLRQRQQHALDQLVQQEVPGPCAGAGGLWCSPRLAAPTAAAKSRARLEAMRRIKHLITLHFMHQRPMRRHRLLNQELHFVHLHTTVPPYRCLLARAQSTKINNRRVEGAWGHAAVGA